MSNNEYDDRKDCAFQFYIDRQKVEDTGLITIAEAKSLWAKHRPKFIECARDKIEAEVALWIAMCNDTNYQRSLFRLRSDEIVFDGDRPCVLRPMP